MKKLLIFYPAIILLLGFSYGKLIDDKVNSILKQFVISESYAKDVIFQNTAGPSFYLPNHKELKSLATSDRVELIESVSRYIKEFFQSNDFKKRYAEYREMKKPTAPEKPKSLDELRAQQKEDIENSIAELENSKKNLPADQQNMFDETITIFKEQLKELDNSDNPMFSQEMEEWNQQSYQQQMVYHKQQLANWEKEYPASNTKPMIKKWLKHFLDQTASIDYDAKLKDLNGRKVFVNPEYEKKDYYWKLYFRAGKETVEAARKIAKTWLSEF